MGLAWVSVRGGAISISEESSRWLGGRAAVRHQVAQGDDVAVPVGEVHRRVDHQVLLHRAGGHRPGFLGVLVDLHPDRPVLPRLHVQQDHAEVVLRIHRKVGHGRQSGGREILVLGHPRHRGKDLGAGAEAIAAVPLVGLDGLALGVARHGQHAQVSRRLVALLPSGLVNQSLG